MEDMLRVCAIFFQGSWGDHLDLIEFSYNTSYHASKDDIWGVVWKEV